MNRENSRRSEFKRGIDAAEGRRRRTETSISLRKNKKEEGLAKRRLAPPAAPAALDASAAMNGGAGNAAVEATTAYTAADIATLKTKLSQPDIDDAALLDVVRGFRKMLSVEHNPPVDEVLASGVLPAFVQMLALNDKPRIQFESAWALTNVASTDQTRAVVDAGAVPYLAQLLSSPSAEVREQCAWCLGNIAGDSPTLRDIILGAGVMQPLLQNIVQPDNHSLLGNCVWTCSNLCRGKPAPGLDQVAAAVPVLAKVIEGANDDIKQDALWALSYVSDGDDAHIQAVLDTGIMGAMIELLARDTDLITPALRIVGNIVSGSDAQTQAVLDAGLMAHMLRLLHHPKRTVRKEACWVVSNIAAGSAAQISTLIKTKGCMQRLTQMAISSEWEVRKEAIWVVSNIATGGKDKHVMSIIEAGAIEAVCSVLGVNDTKMLLVALDAVDSILKVGVKRNKDYASFVDEADGLTLIEALQEHESEEVYEKAVTIIETYFGAEDEVDDENLAPEVAGGQFSFGVPPKAVDEADCPANSQSSGQPFTTFNFAS